jgi:CrcB protein
VDSHRSEDFEAPYGVDSDSGTTDAIDTDLEPTLHPGLSLPHALAVFSGGFLGTLARYLLIHSHPSPTRSVDWLLLVINMTGSLILGALATSVFARRPDAIGFRLFFATGVLGGWTTYSAIIASAITLGHQHLWGPAGVTLLVQLVGPVLAAFAGLRLGGTLRRLSA